MIPSVTFYSVGSHIGGFPLELDVTLVGLSLKAMCLGGPGLGVLGSKW